MSKETIRFPAQLEGLVAPFPHLARPRQMHRHDELELNLIIGGSASYVMTDRRYDLAAGTLIWLYPARDHVLLNESQDFQGWIVVFGVPLVERVCTTTTTAPLQRETPAGRACLRLDPARTDELNQLCERAHRHADEPDYFNAALAYLLMAGWEATQQAQTLPGADVHPAVDRAIHLLRDQPGKYDLPHLAEKVGLSPARLSRLFKHQTGLSITDYRNRRRVERFLRLYDAGRGRTMLAAALEAGFGSYAQFHRAFKQRMGVGPGRFCQRISD